MEFPRRTFLRLATGAAAMPALSRSRAHKPIRRAGALDCSLQGRRVGRLVARLIGQFLTERLGQQFIIEAGRCRQRRAEVVAKARPMAYTLLVVAATTRSMPTLYDKLPFDSSVTSFVDVVETLWYVGTVPRSPPITVFRNSSPARATRKNSSWLRAVTAPSLI